MRFDDQTEEDPEFGTIGGQANAKISCVMAFPGDLLRFTTCDNYADNPYYNNQNVGKCRGACKLTLATGTTAYPTRYSNGGPMGPLQHRLFGCCIWFTICPES